MSAQDRDKARWAEIELKMKFNSCDEATDFWQEDWRECPVCGARLEPVGDDENEWVLVHKDPKLLRQ